VTSEDDCARLRWHCRRGLLELDLILIDFVERHYPALPAHERRAFEQLLRVADHTLLTYLNGSAEPADRELKEIVKKVKQAPRL
jgi:antitoxin CptB